MPKSVLNAKIACIDFSLQKAKMHLGVQVLITDPEKLDAIRQRYYFYENSYCFTRVTFAVLLSAFIRGDCLVKYFFKNFFNYFQ